jgi:hypothetical protein
LVKVRRMIAERRNKLQSEAETDGCSWKDCLRHGGIGQMPLISNLNMITVKEKSITNIRKLNI